MQHITFVAVLCALGAIVSAATAQESIAYWGNDAWGCSNTSSGDEPTFNNRQYDGELTWLELWTFTFSDSQQPIGGMINLWFARVGIAQALKPLRGHYACLHIGLPFARIHSRALVNPFLTDGTQSPSQLKVAAENYPGGAFSSSDRGDIAIVDSNGLVAGGVEVLANGSMVLSGFTQDGSTSWNLRYDFVARESWCTAENAQEVFDFSPPFFFSWRFYMPRALVTGSVTINHNTHQVRGYGESDHPWGRPALEEWYAAYLSDGVNTFYWIDFLSGDARFVRVESQIANTTLTDIEWRAEMDGNRPVQYGLRASNEFGIAVKARWAASVPDIEFDGTVQDVMVGDVSICSAAGLCVVIEGNGWTERVLLGAGNDAAFARLPLQAQTEMSEWLRAQKSAGETA